MHGISINSHNGTNPQSGALVTVLTNGYGYLTKAFSLDDAGVVQKKAAATLSRGTFEKHHIQDLRQLDALLDSLQPTQAVTYGCPEQDSGIIVAQGLTDPPAGAITRTRNNFVFGCTPGVLMLDYDPPKDQRAVSADELIAMLRKACPELSGAAMLWRASSSSGVAGAGIRGQRIYIIISDASQIPRIGKLLFDRLWLAGFGYYAVSKSGQALERGPIDTAVWRPEGLDFAAAPVLGPGVNRTYYDSIIIDGCIVEVDDCKALSADEVSELANLKKTEREKVQPQIEVAKATYIEEAMAAMPKRLKELGVELDEQAVGIMLDRAVKHHVLMGNWPLTTQERKTVTVGMILDNPDKYHNSRFADPLEPGSDLRVAWANLYSGRRPLIYSHAHHGVCYYLERAPAVIGINNAELPRMVDATASILKKSGEIYEHAGGMVYVNDDGHMIPAKPQWLAVQIQRLCRFEGWNEKKQEMVATACPGNVVNGVLADAAILRMDKLTAVRNAPTMDRDGRLITTPGYDQHTSLLLINDRNEQWPVPPIAPTKAQLQAASSELWLPFAKFPYATEADKSVALAAVLTAVVRSCIRTSPGFGFSATAPGTGKTLIAQCIGALYDGEAPAVAALCSNEDEWAKTLFSAALGGAGAKLFDNAEYPIESSSLCALTTAPAFKGRVLGESREAESEHRMLILVTGNGLQFVGDLNRRIFTCRLDAHMEAAKVAAREFELEPLAYCIKNRIKLITAGLTLIQGYARAGFPRVCDGLASMDDWNKLIRSTMVWLIQEGILEGFVDPKVALMRDAANDPVATTLSALLDSAKAAFGIGSSFTVAELIKRSKWPTVGVFDLLYEIAGDRDSIDAKKLGRWLLKYEGRIMDGLRIKRGKPDRQKKATWEICAV